MPVIITCFEDAYINHGGDVFCRVRAVLLYVYAIYGGGVYSYMAYRNTNNHRYSRIWDRHMPEVNTCLLHTPRVGVEPSIPDGEVAEHKQELEQQQPKERRFRG